MQGCGWRGEAGGVRLAGWGDCLGESHRLRHAATSNLSGRAPKGPGQRPPRPRRALLARQVGRWPLSVSCCQRLWGNCRAAGGARQCLACFRPNHPPQRWQRLEGRKSKTRAAGIPPAFPTISLYIRHTYDFRMGSVCLPRPAPPDAASTHRAAALTALHIPQAVLQRAPRARLAPCVLTLAPRHAKGRTLRRGPSLVHAAKVMRARNIPSARYARRYPRPAPRKAAP